MPRRASAINLQADIPAGADLTFEYDFQRSGTITRLYVVSIPGEAGDVRRYVELVKNDRDPVNLVDTADAGPNSSEEYLAGDDVVWDVAVHEEFEESDTLRMRVENDDGTHPYDNIAFVQVRYDGLAGMLGRLQTVVG